MLGLLLRLCNKEGARFRSEEERVSLNKYSLPDLIDGNGFGCAL